MERASTLVVLAILGTQAVVHGPQPVVQPQVAADQPQVATKAEGARVSDLERAAVAREGSKLVEQVVDKGVTLLAVLLGAWIAGRQATQQRREARVAAAVDAYREMLERRVDVLNAMLSQNDGLRDQRVGATMKAVEAALWKIMVSDNPNIRTNFANVIEATLKEMRADLQRGDEDTFERHREQQRIAGEALAEAVHDLHERLPKLPKSEAIEKRGDAIRKAQLAVMEPWWRPTPR